MLAFRTDSDPTRVDQLFRRFALMRPKWDERHAVDAATYGELTVARVLRRPTRARGTHMPHALLSRGGTFLPST